jgi:hypothetical protein
MASTTASVGERREAQGSGTLPVALKVARWTITNLQNCTGYFYYRRYSP